MTIAKPGAPSAGVMASLFTALFSAVMAAGLCYFRHYLGGPAPITFLAYWLAFVMLSTTIVLGGRWYLFWFATVLLLLLTLGALAIPLIYVAAPGGLAALLALRQRSGHVSIAWMAAGGLAAIGLGIVYFMTINGIGYANVLLPERVLAGSAYPDTLFHTALSSMLSNYGELASALDGLTPIRYHAFSHLWLGLMAKGAGLNAVHGYYLGLQILALPLLLLGLALATAAFGGDRARIATCFAIAAAILFLFDRFDWMSYLASESHMVGLGMLLLAIPSLRTMADRPNDAPNRTALLAMGFAILLSAAKISVGATWTLAVVFLLLRQRNLSRPGAVAVVLLLVLHAWLAVRFFLPNDNVSTTGFEPLHFLRNYTLVAVSNLALTGAAAVLHVRQWRRGDSRLWHEVVLLMLAVNILPTLLLRVEGGSAYYFINIAAWLSIASLSAGVDARTARRPPALVMASCLAVVLAMTILTPQKLHAYGSFKNQRNALGGAAAAGRNLFDQDALAAVRTNARQSTGGRIAALMQANGITQGADFLVAVSPDFRAFWTLTPQCNAAPFLVPAYFGVPMLDGLPPAAGHCALGNYYGYRLYGSDAQSRPLDDAALCRRTVAKGFHHLLLVQSAVAARRLDCVAP